MRVVADTNVIVSGLLWHGPSHQFLNAARQGTVELFTSGALLAELEEVLQREKFIRQLTAAQVQPRDLVVGYAARVLAVHVIDTARTLAVSPVNRGATGRRGRGRSNSWFRPGPVPASLWPAAQAVWWLGAQSLVRP